MQTFVCGEVVMKRKNFKRAAAQQRQRERDVARSNPDALKQARRDAYKAGLPPDVREGRKFRP